MEEAQEVAGELVEAGEAAPKVLEFADKTLDEVTLLVKFRVVGTGMLAIDFRGDNGLCTDTGNG